MATDNNTLTSSNSWLEGKDQLVWYALLFKHLALDAAFMENTRRGNRTNREYIAEKLLHASRSMEGPAGETFAFTQMLHTASSVILLEGKPENVDKALDCIGNIEEFSGIDPTMILTSVALYYLLNDVRHSVSDTKDRLTISKTCKRLDQMNWMMSPGAMKELGFETIE